MKAKYIWFNEECKERNSYAYFRYNFNLNDSAKYAELNIFADSFYEVYINGVFVQFGPVRFDPKYPMFDKHLIHNFLKKGENTIAICANNYGCETYKSIVHEAGCIAWGNIQDEDGNDISFSTGNDEFLVKKSNAYYQDAPKMSFALNQIEIFNQANDEEGWKDIDFDDSKWDKAKIVNNQDSWGQLEERNIPFMSRDEIIPAKILQVPPLQNTENIYSFKVPTHFHYFDNKADYSNFIAFKTYIYSPKKQTVTAGLFWGEHFLNGKEITGGIQSNTSKLRTNHRLELNEGWNYFFGKIGAYLDEFAFYLALPQNKGIEIATDKNHNSEYSFMHSKLMMADVYKEKIEEKSLPFNEEDDLSEIDGWVKVNKNETANSPGRESDWNDYGINFLKMNVEDLTKGFTFKKEDFPNGFAIEIDLGFTQLVKPTIDIEGVEGATIDFAYSELIKNGRVSLFHTHAYQGADRANCAKNHLVWGPMPPRGFKTFILTVRNPKNDIKLNSLKFYSAMYPVDYSLSSFECSEPLLNKVWEMCKRTQRIDMTDAFVDCVTREQGMYARDTIIQYHNNLAFFGDHKLMKRSMELYLQGIATNGTIKCVYPVGKDYTISDFSLNMMDGILNHYEFSGDLSVIKNNWDKIIKNLEWFNELSDEREDGFLDADWHINRNTFSQYGGLHGDNIPHKKTGINAVFTFIYLAAIKSVIKMAKALDNLQIANDLQIRYDRIAQNARKEFWVEKEGAFAETLEKNSFIAHSSFLAVIADVPNEEQTEKIKKYLTKHFTTLFTNGYNPDDGVKLAPHFTFYALQGLYKLGLAKPAEQIIKDGWGWMLQNGLTTCSEMYKLGCSLNHAWSASPGYYMSKNILGVKFPEKPNMDIVKIEICTDSVTWAKGSFPHPKGVVTIDWYTNAKGEKIFNIKAPKGVKVIF